MSNVVRDRAGKQAGQVQLRCCLMPVKRSKWHRFPGPSPRSGSHQKVHLFQKNQFFAVTVNSGTNISIILSFISIVIEFSLSHL